MFAVAWLDWLYRNLLARSVVLEGSIRVLAFYVAVYVFYKKVLVKFFPFLEHSVGKFLAPYSKVLFYLTWFGFVDSQGLGIYRRDYLHCTKFMF